MWSLQITPPIEEADPTPGPHLSAMTLESVAQPEQDFGVEEGADVVLHADGEGQFLFQKLPDGDLPLPEDAEGVEADPRLLVDRADEQTHAPSTRSQGMLFSHSRRDAGVGEAFLKKCSAS